MISKIFTGHSFAGAVKYVVEDERRAVVLEAEGVRDWDYRLMTEDFVRQASLNPAKSKACFHAILSFSPDDEIDDKKILEIAQKYLSAMGLSNTQFAIVKHTDKAHRHVHLLANLVGNNGRSIKDSFMGLKGKKIAQRLTRQYRLTPAEYKNTSKIHPEAMSEQEVTRYEIYLAIHKALPFCRSLLDLAERLHQREIETIIKYKSGSSTERQGISFKLGEYVFKGSKVDRQYSLANLEKQIALQVKWNIVKQDEWSASQPSSRPLSQEPTHSTSFTKEIIAGLEKLTGQLLQPEQDHDPLANELMRSKRKKKKKGLSR